MKNAEPKAIFLKDYQAPSFEIESTHFTFDLYEEYTLVTSILKMKQTQNQPAPLELNGQDLELMWVKVNDQILSEDQYALQDESLTIAALPDDFTLSIQTKIKPQENTALEGLYKSSDMFCTQCEAEGFRRITYFLDRPDVMSVYTVHITADKSAYPVLLSNGNLVATQDESDGRHSATWHDPHKKPCYLFALVAGDLQHIEDTFTTMSGVDVTLRIYVEPQNIDKCDYAMGALKRSMKWDEEVYGREYDLNIFNIVAVDAFNMGAMENKSLNIFNSSCVLANPKTATDATFQRIEAIVAHEYFHNWSGNRVTCRDWFQLSLKEGFTVFRDSEFSADMGSRTVKRIEDVSLLRTAQFAEDAGPMAHPILPASFIEISNFYTLTIYEKGAEVVRMIHNILGESLFRKGSDLYFERHDGQAVTTEHFVKAMEDASGKDLSQFRHWYHQAGTPELWVSDSYNESAQTYALTIKQTCRDTSETDIKKPYHIPFAIGLLDSAGKDLTLSCNSSAFNDATQVINVTQHEETFEFEGVKTAPVPSMLRGFSAPVKLNYDYQPEQLMHLMAHDSDGFNQWDAGQTLATSVILSLSQDVLAGTDLKMDENLLAVYAKWVAELSDDLAKQAQMLSLPSLAYLIEQQPQAQVHALYTARTFVKQAISDKLHNEFNEIYVACQVSGPYEPTHDAMAKRTLKNLCLQYMIQAQSKDYSAIAQTQFEMADNMTDQYTGLSALVNSNHQEKAQKALASFYEQWKEDVLVTNMWLSLQAASDYIDGVAGANALLSHPAFDIKNPNKVRAVIGAFAGQNLRHYHAQDGLGYNWLADRIIELDALNPQIASRLLGPLTKWKRIAQPNSSKMKQALEKIASRGNLSKDVYEVVSKSLAD
ncbi:aminopeptidase N [Oceaniserpentilla sp. 4NH20-0058]|uniref:aminopeptidase N n=1 Tax=Oceaniserpentilla sp. 4NH20-0058 TaxID=3127660 RepID=UPI00310C0F88